MILPGVLREGGSRITSAPCTGRETGAEGFGKMSARPRVTFGLTVLLAVLTGLWWAGGRFPRSQPPAPPPSPPLAPSPPAPQPPADQARFVGSAACARCHSEIVQKYQGHPMAQAAAVNDEVASPLVHADAPVTFEMGPYRYRVDLEDGRVVHHEELLDPRGRVVTSQSVHAAYALGSGVRGRSYLIDRGGLLYQSPVSWYSQEGKWDLSPGYTLDVSETRFERRVTDDCLACHVGQVAVADRETPDRLASPPFLELGISCERCHGPGRGHVDHHEGRPLAAGSEDPIVNPHKLDPWRRDSVCFQCHLSARRVLRHGRRHYDFRPGMGLEEIWSVLVHGDDTGEGTPDKAVSHVQEMYSSRCHLQSEGRLACTSCHDPHGVPAPAEREAWYQGRCLQCHQEQGCRLPEPERLSAPQAGSCIGCHMPRRAAGDIAHTSQTDHRIQRRPTDLVVGHDETPLVFFAHTDRPLENWERVRAHALATVEEAYAYRRQDPQALRRSVELLQQALELQPGDPRLIQALGAAHHLSENDAEARRWFELSLRYRPRDEESLKMLGISCFREGDFTRGISALGLAREVNPWNAEIHARQSLMLAVFGRLPEAINTARQGLEIAPTLVPLREDLVKFLEQAGRTREATLERQKLLQIRAILD